MLCCVVFAVAVAVEAQHFWPAHGPNSAVVRSDRVGGNFAYSVNTFTAPHYMAYHAMPYYQPQVPVSYYLPPESIYNQAGPSVYPAQNVAPQSVEKPADQSDAVVVEAA